jgi:hypothetical protein
MFFIPNHGPDVIPQVYTLWKMRCKSVWGGLSLRVTIKKDPEICPSCYELMGSLAFSPTSSVPPTADHFYLDLSCPQGPHWILFIVWFCPVQCQAGRSKDF